MENPEYIHLKNKIVSIKPTEWNYEFDPDEMLKTDHSNLFGEIVSISVWVNRMGLLVADMKSFIKQEKLKLDIKESEVRKLFRNAESAAGRKKPTVQEMSDHLTLDPVIKNIRFKLIREEKSLQDIESIYDATKDKSFKLNNLSKNLTPQDLEESLIEGSVNGVMIKVKNKPYTNKQ